MNTAHLHLMINHLPIIGLFFAILFNLLAIFRNYIELKKISCWLYVLLALISVLAISTGDGAGEIVRTWPGISEESIEYHETWGYAFFYGLIAIGVLSIAAVWFSKDNLFRLKKFNIGTLVLAVLLFFLSFQTGSTGGKIRHPELQQGAYQNNK